ASLHSLLLYFYRTLHHLHSFPTRRSSDLPLDMATCTPGILPCSNWSTDEAGVLFKSLPFNVATAPVKSLFFTPPYPTTTTSSKSSDVLRSTASIVDRLLTEICCDCNPKELKDNTFS